MTDKNNGDWTLPKVDMAYDKIIMGNDPINYYYGLMDEIELKRHYIKKCNKMNLTKNEMCYDNVRLLYDDGGYTVIRLSLIHI